MRTNPFSDAVSFLTGATDGHAGIGWGTVPFVVLSSGLVIGSLAIAAVNWQNDPDQRTGRNLALWLMRALIGAMWLEGSLWKLPLPVSGGFTYWLGLMGENAAFAAYGDFIRSVLIAHIALVNPLIFLTEVLLATSLMLGVAVRLTSLLGVAMALNLWIGLYHFQPEWPWGYIFIALLHVFFIIDRAGRALGLDALLLRSRGQLLNRHAWLKLAV
jgi:uncharacterized membrane protein YphA (DoxX/SURF4 family)